MIREGGWSGYWDRSGALIREGVVGFLGQKRGCDQGVVGVLGRERGCDQGGCVVGVLGQEQAYKDFS